MTEQEATLLITLIPGVKPATLGEICRQFGSFADYFADPGALPEELAAPRRYFRQHAAQLGDQLEREQENLSRQGIALLSMVDERYPVLLREIYRPPAILYVRGNPDALALPQIAVVGSRRASRSGIQQAENFAAALARSGFAVTSGMALGVDGAAHRGALKSGKTIAVLGSGVDVVYPRQHRQLYDDILAAGGAIVSEFPPGAEPLRHHFPQRNRIISGLALGILIVEAAAQSGSLITARLAMEQGREVFAIPGSIQNPMARGCHQLIREGAVLTETLDDIVSQLGGFLSLKAQEAESTEDACAPEDENEKKILHGLGFDPLDVDTLQQLLEMDVADITVALVNLELQGYIENVGGVYQRIK